MPSPPQTLIFIPTYNERDNVPTMVERISALGLDADLLFLDDASPDGTGELLDGIAARREGIHVVHRPGKLGIGGAHLDGIAWAYERGYRTLITLDCDFSHTPEDIPRFLGELPGHDVIVGSRYLQADSLPGWNLLRRALTHFGHRLTVSLLDMPQDATGAFRVYDLSRIPRGLWDRVGSRGYSFFFESLFLLTRNAFDVVEVPIVLPARTYGSSKMSIREAVHSGLRVWRLWQQTLLHPERFGIAGDFDEGDPNLRDPQRWDTYWQEKQRASNRVYDFIAALYRNLVIRRQLTRFVRRHFSPGSELLHAGCGSGQVDIPLRREMSITAVDISAAALKLYRKNNPWAREVRHADVLRLPSPFREACFDGAYNLGVLEHFSAEEIDRILGGLRRVVKPGGKVLVFWPHARASSVLVLKVAHWVLNRLLRRNVQFHPPEISLLRSRRMAEEAFARAGLEVVDYEFGFRDFFIQAAVVGRPAESEA